MGEVIGQLLPTAVGVMLSPLPIVGVILMLLSTKAKVNGPMFLIGWLAGLAIVVGGVVAFVDPDRLNQSDGGPSTLSGVLHLVLGALLLLLAVKQLKGRPKKGQDAEMPKWMAKMQDASPIFAFGMGAFLSGLNPKNLIFDIAAAASIVAADLSSSQQIVAVVVFMILASLTIGIPVIWFLVAGESAKAKLDTLRGYLVQYNWIIMCVLFLVLGVKLIGQSLPAFFD
jgi:threonine/homoserine/homoserine lactone efflux protein